MIGAILDSAGIAVGGLCALTWKKPIPARQQLALKMLLGVATVWLGLKLTWNSLHGTVPQGLKELSIVLLAMVVGRLVGKFLRLQEFSNSIGQYATRSLAAPRAENKLSEGFLLATALFCIGPLAFFASVQEGLNDFSPLFVVKAGTDGLAAMAFCATFGWGAMASALPVLAFQSALIRSVHGLHPMLQAQSGPVLDSITATDGLLIFCVALIILEIKKVRVAEYLPSLALAPLFTRWLW